MVGNNRVRRRGLPFGITEKPRPSWWPPVTPIESWVKRGSDQIWRSFSSGETRFKVLQSGSSWLAYEVIIIEDGVEVNGFSLNTFRFAGAFPTCRAAKRACERISRGLHNEEDEK